MKTILVVEDEPSVADIILRVLEAQGYRVVLASDGQQGLNRLADQQPNMVLSDLMMPILSGTDMYRIMLADPVWSLIPVVLMSAAATPPPITNNKPNYVGFLRKPFNLNALISLVASAIGPPEID